MSAFPPETTDVCIHVLTVAKQSLYSLRPRVSKSALTALVS